MRLGCLSLRLPSPPPLRAARLWALRPRPGAAPTGGARLGQDRARGGSPHPRPSPLGISLPDAAAPAPGERVSTLQAPAHPPSFLSLFLSVRLGLFGCFCQSLFLPLLSLRLPLFSISKALFFRSLCPSLTLFFQWSRFPRRLFSFPPFYPLPFQSPHPSLFSSQKTRNHLGWRVGRFGDGMDPV